MVKKMYFEQLENRCVAVIAEDKYQKTAGDVVNIEGQKTKGKKTWDGLMLWAGQTKVYGLQR